MQIAVPLVPSIDPRSIASERMRPGSPARLRRGTRQSTWVCDRPEVGVYLRRRREALGLTQEELAVAALTTVSSLRKWEAGLRNPSPESLVAWCRALDLPDWLQRKVSSLVLADLDTLQTGTWPPTISDDDLDHLDMVTAPAYYLSFPNLDILAANDAARRGVPSLIPADPASARPTNLVEWVMTRPARDLLANWETVATRLVFLLRAMGPGLVSQQRLDEIFNFCHAQSPREFTRFFHTDLTKEQTSDDLVLVRNPRTSETDQYTYRFLRPVQTMRPYEQLQLVKRRKPRALID